MRILFSIVSILYTACIFFLAGSPVVETLSEFNPYSLLHIPLYGILAILLALSIVRVTRRSGDSSIQKQSDAPVLRLDARRRLFIAGSIASVVAILDEVHQLYVPGRDASVTDVLLDIFGIIIALLLFFYLFKAGIMAWKSLRNRDTSHF